MTTNWHNDNSRLIVVIFALYFVSQIAVKSGKIGDSNPNRRFDHWPLLANPPNPPRLTSVTWSYGRQMHPGSAKMHYGDITWAPERLKSPATSRLFNIFQAIITTTTTKIKAPHYRRFVQWISKESVMRNMFPFHCHHGYVEWKCGSLSWLHQQS